MASSNRTYWYIKHKELGPLYVTPGRLAAGFSNGEQLGCRDGDCVVTQYASLKAAKKGKAMIGWGRNPTYMKDFVIVRVTTKSKNENHSK